MPSGVITLTSAVSDVNGIVFTIDTFLGKIPQIALEILICYQVINIKENYINNIITVVVLIMIYITLKKYKN